VNSPLYTIDVAHPSGPASVVEQALTDGWATIRNSSTLRVLKVIHGYGSSGKGGVTRETVRNWAFAHRKHFRAVLPGEEYLLTSEAVLKLRSETGQYEDKDLTMPNPGITIIWIK